ncbi:sigma-70 family RNA polymerase sigma factor [Haliangium sp.]|uniref:sigma-70 family RNA polymerase sigma factor n=1 Tax=Haliangium sp. TaxID=2663208 RepID=UPI003D128E72
MSRRERLLVRKLRERDERAFREMIERYGDRVYNLTYRMLGNREEAEDVSQEVFITVFKSIDSFRGDSKLSTWLYRIAANHCKNRIKYLSRRHDRTHSSYDEQIMGDQGAHAPTAPTASPRPDRQLEGAELEQVMQRCIATLEDDHRLLIVLRDIEELSYEEICTITQLPLGTVKSRLHRARLALRKKMLKHM